jgi:hypothetical protein
VAQKKDVKMSGNKNEHVVFDHRWCQIIDIRKIGEVENEKI